MTQNDPLGAVALTHPMIYSRPYDTKFHDPKCDDPLFLDFQNLDSHRAGDSFNYESPPVRRLGLYSSNRQIGAFSGIWRFGWIGSLGLAKGLGWDDISKLGCIRYWNRISPKFHGDWTARFTRRYTRKSIGRGARPLPFPYFLDTTPTLKRRFPCAA